MLIYSVKHKPSVFAAITGNHAGTSFGDAECAARYAEWVGGKVEERESADLSTCRIFQAEDYVANTHALLDNWIAQLPPPPAPAEPAPPVTPPAPPASKK